MAYVCERGRRAQCHPRIPSSDAERTGKEGYQHVSVPNIQGPETCSNSKSSSSALGSITKAPQMTFATAPAYKISKAALNALTVQYALSYKDEGFTFIALSPGVGSLLPIIHCPRLTRIVGSNRHGQRKSPSHNRPRS